MGDFFLMEGGGGGGLLEICNEKGAKSWAHICYVVCSQNSRWGRSVRERETKIIFWINHEHQFIQNLNLFLFSFFFFKVDYSSLEILQNKNYFQTSCLYQAPSANFQMTHNFHLYISTIAYFWMWAMDNFPV